MKQLTLLFLLPLFFLLGFFYDATAQVHPDDYEALVALYNATDGDNWTNNTGWDINQDPNNNTVNSSWYGITISGNRVRRISLSSNNLKNNVPNEIGQLAFLQNLYLHYNQLTNVSQEIRLLNNLRQLTLQNNNLSSIPTEIGQLSSLQVLNLSNNSLTELPVGIGDFSSLVTFVVSNNSLTSIPTEIGQISSLRILGLTGNQISDLPQELADIPNLWSLWVDSNSLQFESLERVKDPLTAPITGSWSSTFYSFQKKYATQDVQGIVGQSIQLDGTVTGTVNTYKWFKRDGTTSVEIPNSNTAILTINNTTAADEGTYYCEVTNSIVTGLTLTSEDIEVTLLASCEVYDLQWITSPDITYNSTTYELSNSNQGYAKAYSQVSIEEEQEGSVVWEATYVAYQDPNGIGFPVPVIWSVGLSQLPSLTPNSDPEYGFSYTTLGGRLEIIENGTRTLLREGPNSLTQGDLLKINRIEGKVRYIINSQVVHEVVTTNENELFVDAKLYRSRVAPYLDLCPLENLCEEYELFALAVPPRAVLGSEVELKGILGINRDLTNYTVEWFVDGQLINNSNIDYEFSSDLLTLTVLDFQETATYTLKVASPEGCETLLTKTITLRNDGCVSTTPIPVLGLDLSKNYSFLELNNNLSASYYSTNEEGLLNFKYTERYKEGNLNIHIYNWERCEIGEVEVTKKIGSNWYSLDLNEVCNESEYYVMEVFNENNKRSILNFKYGFDAMRATLAGDSWYCPDETLIYKVAIENGHADYVVELWGKLDGTTEWVLLDVQSTANNALQGSFDNTIVNFPIDFTGMNGNATLKAVVIDDWGNEVETNEGNIVQRQSCPSNERVESPVASGKGYKINVRFSIRNLLPKVQNLFKTR